MTTGNKQAMQLLRGSYWSKWDNTPVLTVANPFGAYMTTVGKKWVGGDNPAFQKLIDKGKSATNAYTRDFAKVIYSKSAKTQVNGKPGNSAHLKQHYYETYGSYSNTVSWDTSLITNNTNAAMVKLYKKLDKLYTSYGGLELLGEFRETVHMIKHPAEALAAYLNERASKLVEAQTKSKNRREAIKRRKGIKKRTLSRLLNKEDNDLRKVISASWLELQFGAKPLLGTLSDIADASLSTFPKAGSFKHLRASSIENKKVVTVLRDVGFGANPYSMNIVDEYEYKITLVARVRYRGQYDGMDGLQLIKSRGGFELSKVIPTLWELAPLSVFVDYFANVGDTLSAALTETRDVESVDRMISRTLIRRSVVWFQPLSYGVIDPLVYREGLVVSVFKSYSREKWTMSIPPLVFTSPIDSLAHGLNLAAFVNLAFLTK